MFFRARQSQKYTAITSPETVKALFPNEEKSLSSFHIDTETVHAVLPYISELLNHLKELIIIPNDAEYFKSIFRLLRWLTSGEVETMTEYMAKLQFLKYISYVETICKKLPDLIGYKTKDELRDAYYSQSESNLCRKLIDHKLLFPIDMDALVRDKDYFKLTVSVEESCEKFKTYPRVEKLKEFFQAAIIKRLGLHDHTLRPEKMPIEEFKLCLALAEDAEVTLARESEKKLASEGGHVESFRRKA